MSKVADAKHNWLDQVKEDAAKATKRRLKDDGFQEHEEKEKAINDAEARVANAQEAEVVSPKTKK